MPEGTWTDDSSMALATMDSIIRNKGINPEDIMKCFMRWEFEGDYTPFGEAFDEGMTCSDAIYNFRDSGDYRTCGRTGEYANGNGALMRILPIAYLKQSIWGMIQIRLQRSPEDWQGSIMVMGAFLQNGWP